MSGGRSKRTVAIGLGAAVVLALGAWIAGGQVRSPGQVAAETAAPDPSAITVPVERKVLESEVIVRGTVRYGSPQEVVLASSELKQSSGGAGSSDIVTTRPRRGSKVSEGKVVMSVSSRPVFILRGAQPSHRDMRPGSRGPDVRQLESALARMGFSPGRIDGRYDGATAAAVASWYERSGWAPFGSTDTQLDQLRTARAAAAAARDALLQSRVAIRTAKERATPAEIGQAEIDLETSRQTLDTAVHDRSAGARAISLALANERRDNAQATSDVTTKRAALNRARDAQVDAQRNLAEAPPDTSPAERAALQAAVRQAADDVAVAQAELNTANAAVRATREAGRDAVARARAEVVRARNALPKAQRQVELADRRLRILRAPGDSTLQEAITSSAAREADGTAADVARLARKMGVQVPANEVLFFGTLPLRVDSVRVRRGDSVTGRVMTVSNSRLAIDSSLSIDDAKLVRTGASVTIEEPDLGVKTTGVVSQVADRPGTHKVDPGRMYLEIAPRTAPSQLVGASVKLTIAVKSTEQAVLTVPVTALSVGADGSSRVQVLRPQRTEYVTVVPGLAAQGLVEVRPVRGRLSPGDLVIVGAKGDAGGGASGSGPGASGTTGGNLKNPPGGTSGSQGSTGSKGTTTSGASPGGTTSGAGSTSGTTP